MDATSSEPQAASEWRRGWTVVLAACLGVGVGSSLYAMMQGMFIAPLQDAFGWSRSEIALAAIFHLAVVPLMPVIGRLVDAYGARTVALVSLVLWSLGYVGLATMSGDIMHFYAIYTAMSAVGVGASVVAFTRPVAAWFQRSRGAALGVTISGVSLTSVFAFPLLQAVIESYGWRVGYLVLAALPVVVAVPAVWLWLKPPPAPPATSGLAAAEGASLPVAARDLRFWLLALAMMCANIPVGGVISQLQPMLHDRGLAPAAAALLGSLFAASVAVGRIGGGALIDRFPPVVVVPACMGAHLVGAAILLSPDPSFAVAAAAAVAFGLAQGAEADFLAFFVARYFGLRAYATIFGALMTVAAVSLAVGGMGYAQAHDRFGSYGPALYAGMGLMLTAAALLIVGERVSRRLSGASAQPLDSTDRAHMAGTAPSR